MCPDGGRHGLIFGVDAAVFSSADDRRVRHCTPEGVVLVGVPGARRMPLVDVFHGRQVPDPYRWLEADDDPECTRWLAEQDSWLACHAQQWRSRTRFAQLLEHHGAAGGMSMPTVSPPVWRGQRRFFLSRGAGQELPLLMAGTTSADEWVVVDPVELDPSGVTTLDAWRPSWSGQLLAYQTSARGSEIPTLRVLEVATGGEVDRPLHPGRVTPVAWLPDDTGFYYVTCHPDGPRQVRRHLLGEHPDHDVVVFSTRFRQLSVSISPSGRWLVISCAPGAQRGNLVYLADLTTRPSPLPDLQQVYDGTITDAQALLKFGPDNLLYVITTDQAPGGQVCTLDPATPSAEKWTPVITADEGTVLSGCVALIEPTTYDIRFVTSSTKSGTSRLSLYDEHGGLLAHIPAPRNRPGHHHQAHRTTRTSQSSMVCLHRFPQRPHDLPVQPDRQAKPPRDDTTTQLPTNSPAPRATDQLPLRRRHPGVDVSDPAPRA